MNRLRAIFDWENPYFFDPHHPVCIWLNVINVTLISMLVTINLLSTVVVAGEIQGAFSLDVTSTDWLTKLFVFCTSISPLYCIHAANKYGYKRLLFLGNVIFSIGMIGGGFATHYYELLFFRALAGLGGGIVITVGLNIITITVHEKDRAAAVTAYSNFFFGFGIVIGLLLGGYFGETGEWRKVFLMNLYFSLPTLLLTWILIPETPLLKHKPFDFFGFVYVILFFLALLCILTQAKAPWNTLGWHSPFIHGCYLVMLITFAAFLLHSHRNKSAIIDLTLFTKLPFCIGVIGLIIEGVMVFGVSFERINFLLSIYHYEYWMVGKFMSIMGCVYLIFGTLTTVLANVIDYRIFILGGLTLIIASCFLSQDITIQSGPFQIGWLLGLRSAGLGLVLGPLTALGLSPFSQAEANHAVGILTFFRQISTAYGSGLIGLIVGMRAPYHALRFGEQVNSYSARYKYYSQKLNMHVSEIVGQGRYLGKRQTNELIITQIEQQAEIAALNDALYILGMASLVIACLIAGLMIYRFLHLYPQYFKKWRYSL